MQVHNFDEFVKSLLEFDQTKHYLDRANLNLPEERKKTKRSTGSRFLPLADSANKEGFVLMDFRNVVSKELETYKGWCEYHEIDSSIFDKFMGRLWKYQAEHKKLDKMPI